MNIDITNVLIATIGLLFNVLVGWAAKKIIPAARAWLEARTGAETRAALWELICRLVEAAEQLLGAGAGSEKFKYVISALDERGLTADPALIEAAVKEMNAKALNKLKSDA